MSVSKREFATLLSVSCSIIAIIVYVSVYRHAASIQLDVSREEYVNCVRNTSSSSSSLSLKAYRLARAEFDLVDGFQYEGFYAQQSGIAYLHWTVLDAHGLCRLVRDEERLQYGVLRHYVLCHRRNVVWDFYELPEEGHTDWVLHRVLHKINLDSPNSTVYLRFQRFTNDNRFMTAHSAYSHYYEPVVWKPRPYPIWCRWFFCDEKWSLLV